jgi:hypothetical protein
MKLKPYKHGVLVIDGNFGGDPLFREKNEKLRADTRFAVYPDAPLVKAHQAFHYV